MIKSEGMFSHSQLLLILKVVTLCVFIAFFSLYLPLFLPLNRPLPRFFIGFITHTSMLIFSIVLSFIITKGNLIDHGYTFGSFRLTVPFFLWVLPMSFFSVLHFVTLLKNGNLPDIDIRNYVENILFVWLYASICEEVFTRGLLQGLLNPLQIYGFKLFGKWFLSIPILVSGFFFGLMHIVAIPMMGPMVIVFTSFAGIVAAYYREKTASLIPAIIIHALFNIGGMLPFWLLNSIYSRLCN